MWYLLYTYKVTAKHAHRLYSMTIVVDYNLILKFFNIGDVKYPHIACDCEWLDFSMCLG